MDFFVDFIDLQVLYCGAEGDCFLAFSKPEQQYGYDEMRVRFLGLTKTIFNFCLVLCAV